DVDRFRNGVGGAHDLDGVGNDVDGATAFHARRLLGVHDVNGDAHANLRPFPEPQEIDVDRQILDRIELEIAWNHAMLGAVHIELVDRGEEAPGTDPLLELGMIDRDGEGGLVVAVDHARHAAVATHGPGGPLAGLRARYRLHFLDVRHWFIPLKLK